MANKILPYFAAEATLAMTLAGLPSSTSGVGRQSDMVDNSVNRFKRIRLFIKTKLGTGPSAGKGIYFYGLRGDKNATAHRTDNAGPSDAALTIINAELIGVIGTAAAPATGDVLLKEIIFEDPGLEWGIAGYHDTGVNLDATAGNHWVRWIGEDPEVQ